VQTPTTELSRSIEFTTFMRAYQDMVFSTAVRMVGGDAEALDISQEVFTRAFEHFEQLRSNPAAGGWLKTATTHLALNHLTRYRKRFRGFSGMTPDEEESLTKEDLPLPDTLLADLSAEQRRVVIDDALQRLPHRQRVPLVLYHFDELSYEEIAARLQISLSKVKTDIRRARAALLRMLQSSGMARDLRPE
jgi:RNA polymerase sigma-70 factor (ECF subfamily)